MNPTAIPIPTGGSAPPTITSKPPPGAGLPIRQRLLLLVTAVALPLAALSAWSIWSAYVATRAEQVRMLLGYAKSAAALVDRDLGAARAAIQTLSASPALARGDLQDFQGEARAVSRQLGGANVNLIRPDGQVALSSALPVGESHSIRASDFALQALRDDRPENSDLVFGRFTHEYWVGTALPVAVGGQTRHWLLTLYLPQNKLSDSLESLDLPVGWMAVIADRQGRIAARLPPQPQRIGQKLSPELLERMSEQPQGVLPPTHRTSEGTAAVVAFATSASGYRAAIAIPASLFLAPQRAALARTVGIAFLISLFGLLAAWRMGASIVGPLRRLALAPFTPSPPSKVPEIDALAHALRTLEQERRTSDVSLRESEERLALATAAAGIGIWDWNLLDNTMRYSDQAKAICGFDPAQPVTYEMARAVTHPEDLPRTSARARRALDPEIRDSPVFEYRLLLPDGQVQWVTATGKAVFAEVDGTVRAVRYVGTIQDITERKRTEEELRASEARLKLALSAGRMAVWEYDAKADRIMGSPELYRLLGYPEGVVPTLSELRSRYVPGERERVQAAGVAAAARGERFFSVDYQYCWPDGSLRWLAMRAEIIYREAEPTGVVGVLMDITAAKETEMALRNSEQRLRDLLSTLDLAAVFTRDLNGMIQFWSQGCERIYGWPAAIAIGSHAHDLLKTEFPEPPELIQETLIATGEWEGDLKQRCRDGTPIVVAVRKVLRRDEAGTPVAVMESVSDVTALREARVELERLNAELECRVAAEVAAREAAQARAAHAERMQALGQLAGGIAHDFNNVLQAVTGAAALIERRPAQAEQVSRFARLILDAAGRGSAITRRLLAFARKGDLRAEPISVREMLEGLREILTHTLGSSIDIVLEVGTGLPRMLVDRGQLETVLVNLATNARDAMPNGGTLTIKAEAETIGHAPPDGVGLPAGKYVAITVADTGTGMTSEMVARATEPFFTTKKRGEGTGLGLAMAKGFAEQSGGGLTIRSEPGRGTAVTIHIPQAPHETVEGPVAEDAAGHAESSRARVLLVDDDPLVRESLAAQLEALGFAVRSVSSAAAALALVRDDEAVDALVTDLSMPDTDGLALIQAAQAARPRLPAVLLTGYAGDSAALAIGGAVSGSFSLLRKPIQANLLADRISALLEARRASA